MHIDSKRLFDLCIAIPALLVSLPLQGLVALAVRMGLGAPVLFKQQRPGLHGRPFTVRKFRTMLPMDPSRGWTDDASRMTRLGAFLRSTSLDELPSLWNVVRGDMSLVGPRPLLMDYLSRYNPEQSRRHEVRPGLTGLAQVSGRNATAWDERLRLDVQYVDSRTLGMDLRILGRTVVSVLRREGISSEGSVTMPEFWGSAEPGAESRSK